MTSMYSILGWLGVIFEFHGYNFSCPFLATQMLRMLLEVDFFVMVSLIHLKKKYFSVAFDIVVGIFLLLPLAIKFPRV